MTSAAFFDSGLRYSTLQPVWLRTKAGEVPAIVCNDAGGRVRVQPYADVEHRKMSAPMDVGRWQLKPMKL